MINARSLIAIGIGVAAVAALAGACTIFDGLDASAPTIDGGTEGGSDSGGDALPLSMQPGYLSLADGVAFCTNAFACPLLPESVEFSIDVPVDPNHFSSCVDWVSGPLPKDRLGHDDTAKYLGCIAKATSCAAAGGCLWYEVVEPSDPRCTGFDGGANGSCGDNGNSVYYCGSNSAIEHCDNGYYIPGSTCLLGTDKSHYCAMKTCTGDECNGNFLEYCGANTKLFNGYDCAVGGFSCGFDSSEGYNDCLTNGIAKTCSSLSVTCETDTVAICDSAYESHYDCGTYGGTCDQTGFPRCKRPGETCTPLDVDVDVCSGNVITMCVGGAHTTFDCASIGKTCASGMNGQSSHCQ